MKRSDNSGTLTFEYDEHTNILTDTWKGCGSEWARVLKKPKNWKSLDLKSEKARSLKKQCTLGSTKKLCTVYEKATELKTGIVSVKIKDLWI